MKIENFKTKQVEQISEKQLEEIKGGAIGGITVVIDDI